MLPVGNVRSPSCTIQRVSFSAQVLFLSAGAPSAGLDGAALLEHLGAENTLGARIFTYTFTDDDATDA